MSLINYLIILFHNNFFCPLTLQIFRKPVIAEDGFTYERTAITQWLETNSVSPMTRAPISKRIINNILLEQMISDWKEKVKNLNLDSFQSTPIKSITEDNLDEKNDFLLISKDSCDDEVETSKINTKKEEEGFDWKGNAGWIIGGVAAVAAAGILATVMTSSSDTEKKDKKKQKDECILS